MGGKPCVQRLQPPAGAADPAGQGRAVEIDALAGEDLRLTVQRQVVAILADQNVGDQPRRSQALCDRPLGRRRLVDRAAAAATVFGAADTQHTQASRYIVQHLADRLADLVHRPAAAGTGAGADVQRHILTRQMVRQVGAVARCTPGLLLFARYLGGQTGHRSGDIGIEVLQAELKLIGIETFGTASEPAALQCLDDLPQPVDLGLRLRPLAIEGRSQLADYPMQCIDVIRQRSEIDVHEPNSTPIHGPGRAPSGR